MNITPLPDVPPPKVVPALGLAEVLAVWGKPRQRRRATSNGFLSADIPNAFAKMDGAGVICLVHAEGFCIWPFYPHVRGPTSVGVRWRD